MSFATPNGAKPPGAAKRRAATLGSDAAKKAERNRAAQRAFALDDLRTRAPRSVRTGSEITLATGAISVSLAPAFGGRPLATTTRALRCSDEQGRKFLFIPRGDVEFGAVSPSPRQSYEPPFGEIRLWRVATVDPDASDDPLAAPIAFSLEAPSSRHLRLANHLCFVADQRVLIETNG